MLGYGKSSQRTRGLHMRLRSRAFVFVSHDTGQRILLSINDLPMVFESVHSEVLSRLSDLYGLAYSDRNVLITATHTHCGPGGYSHHLLYNSNTGGFRSLTFEAIVDGIIEAAVRAHRDLAPTELMLGHGELHDASSNRSPAAFERNPLEDRAQFPGGIDPQTTVLAMKRKDDVVGVINWFPTHCTSMTNRNLLISSDNKGYAAYHWERLTEGIDYLDDEPPSFISAFAQTNAGDMSPNLNHRPGSGPTENQFDNTRIIGERQYEAAAAALKEAVPLEGPVDSVITYVNLASCEVAAEFTGDGKPHRTGSACGGAASFAGTDEGPGFAGFRQGRNRFWDGLATSVWYRLFPRLREAQAPKGIVVPGGLINRVLPLAQERVPVQLLRIGPLHLLTIPGEATIVAGLRLRRAVANVLGISITNVVVAGYSNAYIHYVTTPEEYELQRYEGGSTLFGRWELGAFQQTAVHLAEAMRDGIPASRGDPPAPTKTPRLARTPARVDEAPPGRVVGDVLSEPRPSYLPGEQVTVVIAGANPNNDLRRGSTYFWVERLDGVTWTRVADDGDWSTKLHWTPRHRAISALAITWDIGAETPPGRYRITCLGAARQPSGGLRPVETRTRTFRVGALPANH
jgi:neutral ceramidase